MTIQVNNFAGGSAGIELTVANSGGASGTAFTALTNSSNPAIPIMFTTVGGAIAARMTMSATTLTGNGRWQHAELATKLKWNIYWSMASNPSSTVDLMRESYGTSSGNDAGVSFKVGVNTNGTVFLSRTGTGTATTIWTSTGFTLPTGNTKVRFEVYAESDGVTAGNGQIQCRVYLGDSSTIITGMDSTLLTSQNLTGANGGFTQFRWGKLDTNSQTNTFDYYRVKVSTQTDAVNTPEPLASNVAPTALANADQDVQVGATVTLSGSGTDSDGTITGYQWTCTEFPDGASSPTITNATSASATFTAAAAGRYTMSLVVTDNLGGTSAPDTMTVYVYPVSGGTVKAYSVTAGSWANAGGTSSIKESLNDAVTGTYAESPAGPTGQVLTVVMCPFGPGSMSIPVSGYSSGGPVTRKIDVYKADGTTNIYSDPSFTLPTSDTAHAVSLDSAALLAVPNIADRRALVVKVADTAA